LVGTYYNDVIIGGLGADVLFGNEGNDILIGGTEDFNSFNRDRAFGGAGQDVFVWAPGDGNDFFDGGEGIDVLMFGLIGETRDRGGNEGGPFFDVTAPPNPGSRDFDGIFLDEESYLPVVDVFGLPGFCEVVETGLDDLNLDHLIRFSLTKFADEFDAAVLNDENVDQSELDTGLRVAVHLKNTEYVVCASRTNDFVIFDLQQYPYMEADISQLPLNAQSILRKNLN